MTTETQEKYQPERSSTRTLRSRSDLSAGGRPPYPAKLVALYETSGDYGPQMYIELARDDAVWEDTQEPVLQRQWLSLTGSDGEPIWEGSDTDQVAVSFEEITGEDFFSDEAESLIGTHFMVEDQDTGRKTKKDKAIFVTIFTENLGTDFKYEGKVRQVPSKNDSATVPEQAEAMSDNDVAAYLASIFNGQPVADLKAGAALNMVKDDPALADVKTVFGKTLRGGLVRPQSVLIGLLIENGFAKDVEGTFTASEDDIPFE